MHSDFCRLAWSQVFGQPRRWRQRLPHFGAAIFRPDLPAPDLFTAGAVCRRLRHQSNIGPIERFVIVWPALYLRAALVAFPHLPALGQLSLRFVAALILIVFRIRYLLVLPLAGDIPIQLLNDAQVLTRLAFRTAAFLYLIVFAGSSAAALADAVMPDSLRAGRLCQLIMDMH